MVLGLQLGSVAGGFAARGSQVFEKVEEDMSRLMEIKLKDNLTRGQARWEQHKAEKKAKRTLAKTLKSYGLTVDQIGVALEQGRGQEVVDYFREFDGLDETTKQNLGYKGTNIINMGEGYEASGMTMDEMLNTVTGKVSGGMNMTDALTDTVGTKKQNIFAKFLSPDTNKIAQRQLKAYEAVYGKGTLNKMGQYASGTIEASDLPFTGTINLKTQLDKLAIQQKLKELVNTGQPSNFTKVTNYLTKQAAPLIAGTEIGLGGNLQFVSDDAQKKAKAGILAAVNNHIAIKIAELQVPGGQEISAEQIETIRLGLGDFVKNYSPTPRGGGGDANIPETMTKMETGVRTGTGPYGNTPRLKWVKEYTQYLIDIGRASTPQEAGELANTLYDALLTKRRDLEANKSNLSGRNLNPRGTGGYKGTD